MTHGNTLDTFKDIDPEDLEWLMLELADNDPTLFSEVVDAMEYTLNTECLREMSEETCNGQPIYPELAGLF